MNTNDINANQIEALLDRYKAGTPTSEDLDLLENWYQNHQFPNLDLNKADTDRRLLEVKMQILQAVDNTDVPQRKLKIRLWAKVAVAASVLLTLLSVYFMFYSKSDIEELRLAAVAAGIKPGGNKAILTLSDGRKIILSNAKDGQIVSQAGLMITKEKDGTVVFTLAPGESVVGNAAEDWNSIQTPKGGQYQVVLSDGSKVWLNAQSVLKFPSKFAKALREVAVSGEAYFQIAKHTIAKSSRPLPFVVQAGNQRVRVLGTQFNINSYLDEHTVKTTLLEGSIAVSYHKNAAHLKGNPESSPIILKPGEQSELLNTGAIKLKTVDVQEAVDWQKGNFAFDNEDIYQIMRKVSRWYDIEVIYESELPTDKIGGTLSRYQDVSKLLDIVQRTGLFKFKIQGKTVYVRRA